MKPIFTIHAGEYIVGEELETLFKKYDLNIWIPSKDTGIDLLVTNGDNSKCASIQVKFSKDFSLLANSPLHIKAQGWWKLDRNKIAQSKADFWVFVLHSFERKSRPSFIVIRPDELLRRFEKLNRIGKGLHSYICVTSERPERCWETRGLSRGDMALIYQSGYENEFRELSQYLSWNPLLATLGLPPV